MLPILLATALTTAPAVSSPGWFDGETLVAACESTGSAASAKQGVCFGYVSGAVDAILMQQASTAARSVCPPPGLKLDMAVRAVLARASWATKARGIGAASFVKLALEDAFPCRSDQDVM